MGPNAEDCLATGELAELFCRCWGEGARWTAAPDGGPKVQSGVHHIIQLLPIIDPARVVDSAARLIGGFFMMPWALSIT